MEAPDNAIDLGEGFSYVFIGWSPDRELNPQYEGIPDIDKMGVHIYGPDGVNGHVTFDTPEIRQVDKRGPYWQLISLDPLHIEPSIQMYKHNPETHEMMPSHHGYIRNGRWSWA